MEVQYLQIVHTSEVPLKKLKFFKNPQLPQSPLSFFQRLRGTLYPEGNQLSVNWLVNEPSLLAGK